MVLDETFMSVQSAYAVFVVEHLNQQYSSHLRYYSSLIPARRFLFTAACSPLFFVTRASSICPCRCFFVCVLSVFLWSLLHYTSVDFWPSLSSLSLLFCLTERDVLLMCLLLKAWKTENSSLAAFQTNSTHLAIMQNITTDIQYLAICPSALIYSLFKQLNGVLWCEPFCMFIRSMVTTNW